MGNAVIKTCRVCKRTYQLGIDGVKGDLCDEHAGVKRDRQGHAWFPGEEVHVFEDGARITRSDAGAK